MSPLELLDERPAMRSEYVWVVCPRCGGALECFGIRDAIAHAVHCPGIAPAQR